jgi:rubrerythrin
MEILQFAIDMEKDGEKYYLDQAAKNEGNALRIVFRALAWDEAAHARLLQGMLNGKPGPLVSDGRLSAQMSLFRSDKSDQCALWGHTDQAEVYRTALEKERKSIDLYTGLRDKAKDDASRALFSFLVSEEQKHFDILEELFRHVNRPNEWVESAEFGIREEY